MLWLRRNLRFYTNYRKKRGHQPTGMVSPMAKAGGFTSVSDMIHVKGAQNVCNYKRVKETCASPGKLITE
ncbi:hypothetical protein Tco_0293068, partial [Tanacetum coccineum]